MVRLPAAMEPEQPRTRIVDVFRTEGSELNELHLRAGELDHVAVAQVGRVAGQLRAVDGGLGHAFHVGQHVAARALGDGGHLHTGLADGGAP